MSILWNIQWAIKYTLYHQVWLKFVGKWQTYPISTKTTPPFLSILSVIFNGSLLVALKKSQFVGDEMRMQTCRVQTDSVIADACSDHHWQPQPRTVRHLVKIATALFTCSRGISSQMVCKATFNSAVVLCFGWSLWFMILFQHCAPDVTVGFKSEPVRIQSVLHDARTLRKAGCLGWNSISLLSLIHIWRCRRSTLCRSRWSPYH